MLTRLTVLSACLLVGCQTVDSENVRTDGMYAEITATAAGDGFTIVQATLYLESPSSLNFVELEGDDLLSAYGPMGEEQIMRESQFLGTAGYSATFQIESENSEFIVGLSRIVDISAPDSRVTLPAPFEIGGVEDALSRANDNLGVTWEPSNAGDEMDYSIDGDCIESVFGVVTADGDDDPGFLLVPGTELLLRQGDGIEESCDATLTVRRMRTGFVDDNYGHGGDAVAIQTREIRFTTQP